MKHYPKSWFLWPVWVQIDCSLLQSEASLRTQPQGGNQAAALETGLGFWQNLFPFFFAGSLTHFALENEVEGGFSLVAVQTWAVL